MFFTLCWSAASSTSFDARADDTALGEEHTVDFASRDAFLLVQDALRGNGILFDVKPDNSLVTLWKDADSSVGFWRSLFGSLPRYRYEIQVVPEAPRKSKIVVNVRAENISPEQLPDYKANKRFGLFRQIDELGSKYPPPSNLPSWGGVNFVVLPGEDLRALAKRTTGNPENWQQIAKDNGLSSPSDATPFQTIWVRSTLLKQEGTRPMPGQK